MKKQLSLQELAALGVPVSNIILALDQSTRVSGWAIFIDEKLTDFGHWEQTNDSIAIRIHSLCEQIQQQITKYNPTLIALENIQLQHGDVSTFQKLAQVQGGILCLCQKNKIPYSIVYASDWRASCNFLKGADNHRESQKKIAQDWVSKEYGKKCTQDEADAICIGYAAYLELDSALEFE